MPPISEQVQKNAQRIVKGGDLVQVAGPSNNAANPTPMPAPPAVTGLPVRGYYPQGMTLDQDYGGTSQVTRTGPNMRSPTFPKQISTAVTTIIKAAAAAVTSAAASLLIKVNGAKAPNQSIINFLQGTGMTITTDAGGNLTFVSTATGDNLTHGEPPTGSWESDPAYIVLRDEFVGFHNNAAVPVSPTIGQLGWSSNQTSGAVHIMKYYTAGNWGILQLGSTAGTAGQGYSVILDGADASYTSTAGFPLAFVGNWQAEFIFRYPKFADNAAPNPATQLRFYLGFACAPPTNSSTATFTPRPSGFIGLRYDTDPNSFTLSAVANASGGNTVYTGVFTGATSNAFYGESFTVSGFANGNNNGTFTCVALSTTTITLNNPNGVAVSAAGTCAGTAFSDTHYKFEAVQNGNIGSNIQGTVVDSGIAIDNNWHRFRMRSLTAGTILFQIDNNAEKSITVGVQTITASSASGEFFAFTQQFASGGLQATQITQNNPFTGGAPCPGTPVVIAGATGSPASSYNGTFTALDFQIVARVAIDTSSLAPTGSGNSTTGTVKFYNSFAPYIQMINDTTGSNTEKVVQIDFFSFIWNPNLGSSAPGTPDPTKARYW